MEEFQEQVLETVSFNVGNFEGRHSTKKWICLQEDLEVMYKVCAAKSEILPTPLPLSVMKMTVCQQRKNQEKARVQGRS